MENVVDFCDQTLQQQQFINSEKRVLLDHPKSTCGLVSDRPGLTLFAGQTYNVNVGVSVSVSVSVSVK
ncbi:hypothetical protein E4U43_000909, partial [Claviceps pusilla]